MKVLVTGGCGFIGSHICEFYRKKGWDVVAYDNMTKYELTRTGYDADKARDYNFNFLKNIGVEIKKADIRDISDLSNSAKSCNYIIHTAAQPAMTIAFENPELDFSTNVIGTFNVLLTAKKYNLPVANCCTIHVYGNGINNNLTEEKTRYIHNPSEIDENYPTMSGKITPLHASKKSAEDYVRMFIDSYDLKAASFRLTGLYGSRQFGGEDHGWVANFAIRTIKNQPITIFNTGKQVRDILYATDLCEAFHCFFEYQVPGIYTIGGGESHAISLIESIDVLAKLNNNIKPEIIYGGERFGDLLYFVCDSSKARKYLKWFPKIKPAEGISILYQWIKENQNIFNFK